MSHQGKTDPSEDPHDKQGLTRSALEARQGRIILRKRWQRVVFIAGLVGIPVVGVALTWLAAA